MQGTLRKTLLLLIALAPLWAAPAGGQEIARAVEIVDGDTLVLDDGREVRLVGIQAPKLPLGRKTFEAWPLAGESKAALAALSLDRDLRLDVTGQAMDRHGRHLAHLYALDAAGETWVQGALLEQGLARVYSFADNRALVAEMLAQERNARVAGRGIWGHPFYRVRDPAEAARHTGTFQVVEGTVLEAATVRGRVYLNFGADWKEDFTITLAPAVRRLFEAEGVNPEAYAGRRVRVRGWLKSFNGPMIEATHPEQIEVLDP